MKLQEFDGGDVDGTKPGRARDEQGMMPLNGSVITERKEEVEETTFSKACRTSTAAYNLNHTSE